MPPVAKAPRNYANKCWIGFEVEDEELKKLCSEPDKHPPHITYIYLGDNYSEEAAYQVEQILHNFSLIYPPFSIELMDGVEVWNRRFVVKLGTVPQFLFTARKTMSGILSRKGLTFSSKYKWNPHVTLSKIEKPRDLEYYNTNTLSVPCSKVFLRFGVNRTSFKMKGDPNSRITKI